MREQYYPIAKHGINRRFSLALCQKPAHLEGLPSGGAAMIDFHTIKQAAHGQWESILIALGVPSESLTGRHCPCPGCGGKDRFRFVPSDPNGKWFCGQGGQPTGGDGFDLLCHACGLEKSQSLKAVADYLGIQPGHSPASRQAARKRAVQAQRTKMEQALCHELIVLNIALHSHTDKTLPQEPDREVLAARHIYSMIGKLYPVGRERAA